MLLGPDQASYARRLDQEIENLRAARRWCARGPAPAVTGLRLAAGLWEYWHIRGRFGEGAEWLEEALAPGGGSERVRAAALNGFGGAVALQGDYQRACELFIDSIESFQKAGELRGEARVWAHLGNARAMCGDPGAAMEAFGRGLTISRASAMSGWRHTPCFCPDGWQPPCPTTRQAPLHGLSGVLNCSSRPETTGVPGTRPWC